MAFAEVNDIELYYEDEGSGEPVVLIHGLAGDSGAWSAQAAALRDEYRVIRFDNRGAGRSTQREEPVSLARMAEDTLGLMTHLGIDSAHIVGRSMGGAIAQLMALSSPTRVRSLVLCASFARLDALGVRVLTSMREVLEWRGNWGDHARHSVHHFLSHQFYNENPALVQDTVDIISSEDRLPSCYVAQNHACLVHDTVSRLDEITCPTLIMAGGDDPICSPTATRWLSEGLPNSRTSMYEGSSHFFLLEQPERFMNELKDWLAEQSSAESARVGSASSSR